MTNMIAKAATRPFLKTLFFVEMWERFSYYGMRALLVLFLTSRLGFTDKHAYTIYSLFAALGYAGPVLGGFIADKLLGFRNMVLLGAIVMITGHALMTLVALDPDLVYFGLGFIAIGTGLFKGNVTNLLGACYAPTDTGREKGFSLFYVGVNLGSFSASIACGYIASLWGWHYGFALAGLGMVLGLVVFIKGQKHLADAGLAPNLELLKYRIFGLTPMSLVLLFSIVLAVIAAYMLKSSSEFAGILNYAGLIIALLFARLIYRSPADQRENLLALTLLIIFLMCFFAVEMQLSSFINLFTERNVEKRIFGFLIPASVFQALNPLSIILFGLIMSFRAKPDRRYKTFRFALGLFTMVICFGILYLGCLHANTSGQVPCLFLIAGMAFMGLGELLIAPLVQEQATLLAPPGLKGFVMGTLMLSLAFSNLAGIVIAEFMSVPSVQGEVNLLESLNIYKEGFTRIIWCNLGLTLCFLVFSGFIHKVISKTEN